MPIDRMRSWSHRVELFCDLGRYLERCQTDVRANGYNHGRRACPCSAHALDGCRDDARDDTLPARVDGGHGSSGGATDQDWHAVRRAYADCQIACGGDERIGCPSLNLARSLVHEHDIAAVDLWRSLLLKAAAVGDFGLFIDQF